MSLLLYLANDCTLWQKGAPSMLKNVSLMLLDFRHDWHYKSDSRFCLFIVKQPTEFNKDVLCPTNHLDCLRSTPWQSLPLGVLLNLGPVICLHESNKEATSGDAKTLKLHRLNCSNSHNRDEGGGPTLSIRDTHCRAASLKAPFCAEIMTFCITARILGVP